MNVTAPPTETHPLDQALALSPADVAEGASATGARSFTGAPHPAYANMVGPFGGVSAAQMLQAVCLHPGRLGDPISLTVNFAAGVADAPFRISAEPARTNRSTQHWVMRMTQLDADGTEQTVLTATAVTAVRRATWGATDTPMPAAPAAQGIPRAPAAGWVRWIERYDMRPLAGPIPADWDGSEADSLTRMWVRDDPPRPLDFAGLAALSDVFYPRIWRRRATRTLIGTVSMTAYFHVDAAALVQVGEHHLLAQAQGQAFYNGFFDQSGQLWSPSGQLLVTTHQIVYFKE
ncbi:MAG: thioesterase family protein [Ottowia sp.]|nr:thioesterase family protein [Ottowia sp.]